MTRDELILRTRQLIDEGERLSAAPSLNALQTWLQLSDDLLATAWGSMDRYHLSWLMVGKPKDIVRGRPMTQDEADAYVREVASQKTAALRMSLDAVERQGMPFRGETGGVSPGQRTSERGRDASGAVDGSARDAAGGGAVETDDPHGTGQGDATAQPDDQAGHAHLAAGSGRSIPLGDEMTRRLEEARRAAAQHEGHGERRAPRPERMQR
jgi:hypothetical protein